MEAPRIDKRSQADIVAQTETLAQQYSVWRPVSGGKPDAGGALIRIFARFAEIIVERLNRVPEKNFLAFLNLIGTELLPPEPARTLLTFRLAENSPVDAVVPAGTQVAAAPLEGEEEEVIFETTRDLVVTRAQLQAVFVRDTETDQYSDRTQEALEQREAAFKVFQGEVAVPHELYIACDEVLTKPGEKDITVIIKSPDTWQWTRWTLDWSYWDEDKWRSIEPAPPVPQLKGTGAASSVEVSLKKLPPLKPHEVNRVAAGWLRAQLALAMPPAKTGLIPDAVASGEVNPEDLYLPYYPFGDRAPVARFYVSVDEAFVASGALVRLSIKLARPGVGTSPALKWTYFHKPPQKADGDWIDLGQSSAATASAGSQAFGFSDGTLALTKDGEVSFQIPIQWARLLYRTRTGRWIRLEISAGQYSTPPQIASITVSYEWPLPRVTGVRVRQDGAVTPLAPEMAVFNDGAIDLTKDFYPFGEQPRYNDAFYLTCESVLARPGATVTLQLTMTNPIGATSPPVPVVTVEGSPTIVWEVWDGQAWIQLARNQIAANATAGTAPTLTASGSVTLTLPAKLAPIAISGEEKHWLRARIVGGHFGKAAGYAREDVIVGDPKKPDYTLPTYRPTPATYAPPLLARVAFTPPAGNNEVAVSNCVSHNDLAYLDYTAAAVSGGTAFFPFTVTDDMRPALYLGLDQAFDQRLITLYLQVEPPEPHEVAADALAEVDPKTLARIAWEYASASGWKPLGAIDATQSLAQRDIVQFIGPADMVRRVCFGKDLWWLRARWLQGRFPLTPRLRSVSLNTMWASQVATSREESLGSGNGNAGQTFQSAGAPILPAQRLEVREPEAPTSAEVKALEDLDGPDALNITLDAEGRPDEIWVRWHAVPDFYGSGPRDRHYTLDAMTGRIGFGDGYHGMLPPTGQNNIRITYRTGGGPNGNRVTGTIIQLKSSVPFVDGVINHEPASGGAERESLDRVAERGPKWLRHRDRSVTAQDLEDLVYEADPSIARARGIVPTFRPFNLWLDPKTAKPDLTEHEAADAGRMGVIVVPRGEVSRPTPSLTLLRRVQDHLQSRLPATASVWVAGPEWVQVTVSAMVIPVSATVADVVRGRVVAALEGFIHPLRGGPDGEGWAFGRIPRGSDLYAVIEAVKGVDHVRVLKMANEPQVQVKQRADEELRIALGKVLNQSLSGAAGELIEPTVERWLNRSLVYSGPHDVRLSLEAL